MNSMYFYLKALHIVFIVTWFAGMFYIVRLFIYNTEANEQGEPRKSILQEQFSIMIRRLWFGITWPSFTGTGYSKARPLNIAPFPPIQINSRLE